MKKIASKLKKTYILLIGLSLYSCTKEKLFTPLKTNLDKQLLLDLVNNSRKLGCNCGTEYYKPTTEVKWNDKLELAAEDHSNDMNNKNNLDHTGSDGSSVGDRVEKHNYNWTIIGENIANGYSSEKEVIDGWIKSTGHCKNIMNPNFNDMGVAKSGEYWTQVLGKHF